MTKLLTWNWESNWIVKLWVGWVSKTSMRVQYRSRIKKTTRPYYIKLKKAINEIGVAGASKQQFISVAHVNFIFTLIALICITRSDSNEMDVDARMSVDMSLDAWEWWGWDECGCKRRLFKTQQKKKIRITARFLGKQLQRVTEENKRKGRMWEERECWWHCCWSCLLLKLLILFVEVVVVDVVCFGLI